MSRLPKHHTVKSSVMDDLGFPESTEKYHIMLALKDRIKTLNLTQTAAAKRIGIHQPDLSNILNGKFRGFSITSMARMLGALDCKVSIVIKPKGKAQSVIPIAPLH